MSESKLIPVCCEKSSRRKQKPRKRLGLDLLRRRIDAGIDRLFLQMKKEGEDRDEI